jgi:hypothetical protein
VREQCICWHKGGKEHAANLLWLLNALRADHTCHRSVRWEDLWQRLTQCVNRNRSGSHIDKYVASPWLR